MNYNLTGKGIFVFSDPAGANSVLALIDRLIENGYNAENYLVFTDSLGVFSDDYKELVIKQAIEPDQINQLLTKYNPDYLFSATSIHDYEHQWRKLANRLNIKTIGFIDHWTNYLERFSFKNETIFPDEIWVINEIAKKEAIQAGIPERLITISGNPYYEKVKNFSPEISKKDFFLSHKLDPIKKSILFISDDIKKSFPSNENGDCILGFDEYAVLSDILIGFTKLKKDRQIDFGNYQLVIKLHPRATENKFKNVLNELKPEGLDTFCLKQCEPLTLNYYSDYVLGMFSNMVTESMLMKKKLLRVEIGAKKEDIFKFKSSLNRITSRKDLEPALEKLIRK
jgi:hypothetical protein